MKIKTSELLGPALDWAVAKMKQQAFELAELTCQRDEALNDAERYRFLRTTGEEYQHMRIYDSRGHLDPEFLDEAIDAAIDAAKESQP